jgi:predicted DCC family thiol-disulfide oxidoreductase YuxK
MTTPRLINKCKPGWKGNNCEQGILCRATENPQHYLVADGAKTIFVLYDDQCPLCVFQMRLLTWLDWFNTITLLPLSNPRAAELAPSLNRADLLEAIHCLSRDGKIYRGARCLRFIGLRLPLFVPVALILWLPGVIWIAEKIYNWISRHRQWLSRIFGCKEACSILPARDRKNEREASLSK